MEDRSKKIARLVKVQERLHEIAELKVARLDREKAGIRDGETRLIAALNDDAALQGLFVEAMARRLAALGRERDRVDRALDAATAHMVATALRLKRTERLGEAAQREAVREAWKRDFADLLDTLKPQD